MAKSTRKRKRFTNVRGRPVQVEHAGQEISGVSAEFTTEQESWDVYRLSDGSRVKVKTIVSDIIVTDQEVSKGVPLVVTRQGAIVVYEPSKPGGRR